MFQKKYVHQKLLWLSLIHIFRLPSAYDNRPLTCDEFYSRVGQKIFVSATPGDFEREKSSQIGEQVIRPTGLLDPEIIVKPTDGQIEDLISEINIRIERKAVSYTHLGKFRPARMV